MTPSEIRRMELPGSGALANSETAPMLWVLIWVLWGLIVACLIFISDGIFTTGACFMAWGVGMSLIGWQAVMFGSSIVIDWAERRLTDRNLEREMLTESFEAVDAFMERREAAGLDPTDYDGMLRECLSHETPLKQRWLQETLFAAIVPAPWFMGLTHGFGVGALFGALLGLIPEDGMSVTSGAIFGCIGGVILTVILVTVLSALFSPGKCISLRHRLLQLMSPLFAVPALGEAAFLWTRWYLDRRNRVGSLD